MNLVIICVKEQLKQEEELKFLNASEKKIMLDTILKWIATAVTVLAAFINAMGYQPLGPILFLIGGFLWLIVGFRWKEMSIVVTNVAIIVVTIVGMLMPKIMAYIPVIQAHLG